MRTRTIFILLAAVTCSLGMTLDGCGVHPNDLLNLRTPPAILVETPNVDSRSRTLEVDLRSYPDAATINWSFGDGGSMIGLPVSQGRRVSHEFAGDGTFTVNVNLLSSGDPFLKTAPRLLAVGSLPIDILGPNQDPVASFVAQDVLDENGAQVALAKRFIASQSRDPDGTIVRYRWNFGDGAQAEGETVEHTFSRSGRFPVRLSVTDDRDASAETTRNILVNTLPIASFSFTVDTDTGLIVTFDASASSDADGAIASYSWDFDDDSAEGSGQSVTHTYDVPDDYLVRLTVTDEFGASASTTRVVSLTGTEPFVRSVDPVFGEVDTSVDFTIDGENFEAGATVRFALRGVGINATDVVVDNAETIRGTLDLSDAGLGDYDVIVENPGGETATLTEGFRVVTPNRVRLETSLGDIVIELVDDAPITTENFLQYVEDGFYDGTIFHRVVPDFVVQGGGFLPGNVPQEGVRDPIVNEFDPDRSNVRGTVAMAKVGGNPDSATSQFFFNLVDNGGPPANLDTQNGGFTVFASVVEGLDVVDAIAAVPLDGESPITDVLIIRAVRE